MSLTEFRRKKMNRQPLIKYLLPLFTALCVAALIITGCADFAGSIDSSDGKKEKFTITVKTQNITSKKEAEARSIFPVLSGSEYYTLSYKSGETWQNLDGTYPNYKMFIIPETYTLKLDAYSDSEKQNHILTGETKLTVTSGMENAEVPFIMQPPKNATGNGSVSLILSAESDSEIDTFEITADSGNLTLDWTKDGTETTYTKGTITADSVQSGTYHLTIYGKTTAGETIYVRSETLTVWSGLESSVWIFADGSSSNELKITASDLYSTFYVKGSTGPYNFYTNGVFGDVNVTASDSNSGNITSPLQTVSAAVKKCVVSGKPYTIYVDGTVKESKFTTNDPTAISIPVGKQITIKSLNSEGETKAVIQADGNGRIMYAGGTVVLENLELKGGSITTYGGGIYVDSDGVLTMKNCTLTDCNATLQGGGLYIALKGSANLSGCTISGNSAWYGGGIRVDGTLIADGTMITENTADAGENKGEGGGIYVTGTVTIKNNSSISNNICYYGGGISMTGNASVTVLDSEISGNSYPERYSNSFGGGIKATGGKLTLERTSLSKNTAITGGGIEASDTTVLFKECKVSENSERGIIVNSGNFTIEGGTVSGNKTEKKDGAGILVYNGTVSITGCTISENSTNGAGGGIYLSSATSFSITDSTISKCRGIGGGGGLYVASDQTATLTGCTISENYSRDGSGAGSGGGINNRGTVNITDCIITSNSANNGGGIDTDGTVILTGKTKGSCVVSSNRANNGGGIYAYKNATVTAKNVTFNGNAAQVSDGGGGALMIRDLSSVTLENCTVSNNTSVNIGGAAWVQQSATVTLKGGSFSGNTANRGNGMRLDGSGTLYVSGALQIAEEDVVYILKTSTLNINGTLTGTAPVLTITPPSYTAGTVLVTAGSGVTLASEVGKIAVTNDSYGTAWKVDSEGKLAKK